MDDLTKILLEYGLIAAVALVIWRSKAFSASITILERVMKIEVKRLDNPEITHPSSTPK